MPASTTPPTFPPPFDGWPRPLAFVLSGGGAHGAVQVGMLRALSEAGLRPDLVVGTSVGSLNGAVVAADPARGAEDLLGIWDGMSRSRLFGHGWMSATRHLMVRGSLSRFDGLESLIDDNLPSSFADLAVPFAAVATDLATGEPELLSAGGLKPALLASSAVPLLYPKVEIDGRWFVDGGVSANVPVRQAIAFGALSVIVLDASPPAPAEVPGGVVDGLLHSVTLMIRNQRAHAIDELVSRYPVAILPPATPADLGSFRFERTAELIELGHRRAAEALAAMASATGSRSTLPSLQRRLRRLRRSS